MRQATDNLLIWYWLSVFGSMFFRCHARINWPWTEHSDRVCQHDPHTTLSCAHRNYHRDRITHANSMVISAVGSTLIEEWMSQESIRKCRTCDAPTGAGTLSSLAIISPHCYSGYPSRSHRRCYLRLSQRRAHTQSSVLSPHLLIPGPPVPHTCACRFNAMVYPVFRMRVKLAIWYQGETGISAKTAILYRGMCNGCVSVCLGACATGACVCV